MLLNAFEEKFDDEFIIDIDAIMDSLFNDPSYKEYMKANYNPDDQTYTFDTNKLSGKFLDGSTPSDEMPVVLSPFDIIEMDEEELGGGDLNFSQLHITGFQ